MIEIKSLKKTYGERTVLDIESFKAHKGERIVLAGPNGSGKSTLLKILACVLPQTSGEFSCEGRVLYMPQTAVAFNMSVKKNLLFSMKEKDEKKCDEVLGLLELSYLKDKSAKSLSGGERQRLALGRILVNDCDVLLLDEPTSAVDIEGAQIIEKALMSYCEKTGCLLVMTTHSPAQAKRIAHRIVMLHNGIIAEQGKVSDVLTNPGSEFCKSFIENWKI